MNESKLMYDDEALDYDEPQLLLYVEKETSLVYQVQMFDRFVLCRPATPGFNDAVSKIGNAEFARRFAEYGGSYQDFYDFVRGDIDDGITATRYKR